MYLSGVYLSIQLYGSLTLLKDWLIVVIYLFKIDTLVVIGNMWAQRWSNIYKLVIPFKNKQEIDITRSMRQQNYTVERMFRTAEEFFASLGMDNMTDIFWRKSMLQKPADRDVVCHASAWDLYAKDDFR